MIARAAVRLDRPTPASLLSRSFFTAVLGALLVAGCGGSAARHKTAAKTVAPAVAHLAPDLQSCLEEWNSAANQTVRFGFDGEIQAAANTPDERMQVVRNAAGACSLVFAGDGTDSARIWTRDAGIWAAQAVLPGETALKATIAIATAHPNVTASITTPPDEENPNVGLLVPLPSAG
jgi:outer membrane murein-binding lipoprotein Lpp